MSEHIANPQAQRTPFEQIGFTAARAAQNPNKNRLELSALKLGGILVYPVGSCLYAPGSPADAWEVHDDELERVRRIPEPLIAVADLVELAPGEPGKIEANANAYRVQSAVKAVNPSARGNFQATVVEALNMAVASDPYSKRTLGELETDSNIWYGRHRSSAHRLTARPDTTLHMHEGSRTEDSEDRKRVAVSLTGPATIDLDRNEFLRVTPDSVLEGPDHTIAEVELKEPWPRRRAEQGMITVPASVDGVEIGANGLIHPTSRGIAHTEIYLNPMLRPREVAELLSLDPANWKDVTKKTLHELANPLAGLLPYPDYDNSFVRIAAAAGKRINGVFRNAKELRLVAGGISTVLDMLGTGELNARPPADGNHWQAIEPRTLR